MAAQDTVYELAPVQYHRLAPLFEDVWIDRALIDAVIEGTEPARVFVDDVQEPRTALMCCETGDYVIAGLTGPARDAPGGPIRRFVRDLPAEAEVFDRRRYAFFMPQIAWGDALLEDFGGEIPVFATRSFRYAGASIAPISEWQARGVGVGATVHPIDGALLARIDRGEFRTGKAFTVRGQEGGEITREELAEMARDGAGYCAVVGGEIASVATVFRRSQRYASLSIDTGMPFRRRGLATLACVPLIEDCLNQGLTPLWNCLASNVGSAGTALRLGMVEGPPQRESQWRGGWSHVTPSAGRWRCELSAGSPSDTLAVFRRTE